MPQLNPEFFASQLFWLLVTFAVLYFVLSKVVLPAVMGIMESRQNTLASDLDRAQRLKTEAQHAKEEYEKGLAQARGKAQQVFAEAQLAHKARMDQAAKEVDAQVAAKLTEAEKKISARKQELLAALTPTATDLASMIVEKMIQQAPAGEKVKLAVGAASKRGS
jgi:F-type H+-transporting ATPase subunit b